MGLTGVTFTVREAAQACAVHANTVRRRLKSGEFPNAFRDHVGTWKIPVVDLEAAGLRPQRSRAVDHPSDVVVVPDLPSRVSPSSAGMPTLREAYEAIVALETESDALRDQVAELARRAEMAEMLAIERAARIDDLRVALRALEAVNLTPEQRAASQPAVTPPAPSEPTPRRGWFRRG